MTLADLAKSLNETLLGDGTTAITGLSSIPAARAGDLVFITDERLLDAARQSGASAVIAGEFARGKTLSKPAIISRDPKLSFARAGRMLLPDAATGIHPTALVDPAATVGRNVTIGPYSVIEAGVTIGDDCRLGPRVVVYSGTTLGQRVEVQAGAVLGSAGFGYARDGSTGRYEKFPQIGRLVIGDDVEIGANCTIDRGALDMTVIEAGVKMDNMVHVAHNVSIGENVVIAAQTGIAGTVVIEKNVVIAGQVGIADHSRIEEGAILGAQCGVPSNKVIRGPGVVFWGTPARPLKEYLRELATLARLSRKK